MHNGDQLGPFKLNIPGRANVLNATAAIIVALKLAIEEKLIKRVLPQFSGVRRRFEKIGQKENLIIIDDYAHHPRSIRLTLAAARQKFPARKIWAVFQPHTYSRTKELLKDFGRSFKDADRVIITEIYASARERVATVSSQDLVYEIKKHQRSVKFIADWSKIAQEVKDAPKGPTIVMTIGAGDIYKLAEKILPELKNG